MKTKTASFGTHSREGHDSTAFYARNLYQSDLKNLFHKLAEGGPTPCSNTPHNLSDNWTNKIYCHTSEALIHVPDNSIALGFTSPPYNAGKDFDADLDMEAYFDLIAKVGSEIYRVLKPGGRYVVNVANLGRKPLIPMHALYYLVHINLGFLPAGEIIWQKARGANGNCAWGSWASAKSPRLRDIHEYIIVFVKDDFSRPDKGESTISGEEFMSSTLSTWEIPPERAKRVGHPAPFPVELAKRVINLYSYKDDVVIDPFVGSGTTCIAAKALGRQYVGYDISQDYCNIAERRLQEEV